MTWGVETDADEAAAQLVAFHDAGGTLVDTAASYGYGEAESLLGHLITDVVARVDLVIASKAGITRTPDTRTVDASRGALLRELDDSLRKLNTDHLDLWYVHYIDDTVPFDATGPDGRSANGLLPARRNWARRLDRPPFYGYALRPGLTFTYAGVEVDRTARVCRIDGGRFENVFAAGEVMAGNILTRGYLAGVGLTIGSAFGRIAGREAAACA